MSKLQHLFKVGKYLEENGAENIWYDCGRLD